MNVYSASPFDLEHAATDRVSLVFVPPREAVTVRGGGVPESAEFVLASQILWRTGEHLRRLLNGRQAQGMFRTLEVSWRPFEGAGDLATAFLDRSRWHWQQSLALPPGLEPAAAESVIRLAATSAGRGTPLVHLESQDGYRAAQLLHLGRAVEQPATVRILLNAMSTLGIVPRREIVVLRVADEARVQPGRAASIVRVPVDSELVA